MGYAIYITRESATENASGITLDEWNDYIDSDPDFKRPEPGDVNHGRNLVILSSSESGDPDHWGWLAWGEGSLHSEYPQTEMLKKIGQIARHFGAVVRSDDGELWIIDENGRVSIEGY